MLKIFRIIFIVLFCLCMSSFALAESRYEDEFNQIRNRVLNSRSSELKFKDNLKQIENKLLKSSIAQKERKDLIKQREGMILEKFKNRMDIKKSNGYLRHMHARKFERMDLKISQKGVCQNPCQISMEAIPNKKFKSSIIKYLFYIDDKMTESVSSKINTTIYFSLNMLTDKQRKLLTKNVPLHKIFRLRAEGIISEDKMIESEIKKLVIKSRPSNLTNIELITSSVMPMNKIQIAINGINAQSLSGTLNGSPITFEIDATTGSSKIMTTIMPYVTTATAKLVLANYSFNVGIIPVPNIVNPSTYISDLTNSSLELSTAITTGEAFQNLIGNNGVQLFTKYNDVILAFDNYIKNGATSSELQEIANIINATTLSDNNVFYFVKSDKQSISKFLASNYISQKVLSQIIGAFISSAQAQVAASDDLKNLLNQKIYSAIDFTLTASFSTIIDGQIDKCYISKGRTIPSDVKTSETYLNKMFKSAISLILGNEFAGAYLYTTTIFGAQALVVRIGLDCAGDTTIDPKLVIKAQPILPISPGESFQYDVKCDVGDPRYYTSNSILTKVTSRFDYKIPSLEETGLLIASDKIVHSCSGLGQDVIKDDHQIFCTTNLLADTQFYQDNISQYTVFNPAQCSGVNSYDVGSYLVDSPSLSCNFVNPESSVNIIGKPTSGNQLVFDLTQKWNCPKAVINYTANNLQVNLDSTDPGNPNISGLTYFWNFGDESTLTTTAKNISHNYSTRGNYTVTLTVQDNYGGTDTTQANIQIVDTASGMYSLGWDGWSNYNNFMYWKDDFYILTYNSMDPINFTSNGFIMPAGMIAFDSPSYASAVITLEVLQGNAIFCEQTSASSPFLVGYETINVQAGQVVLITADRVQLSPPPGDPWLVAICLDLGSVIAVRDISVR